MKSYLILKSDSTSWLLTYEPESRKRIVYAFYMWLLDCDPYPAIEPAESWLEHESGSIEAVYPIDVENRIVRIDEKARLDTASFFTEIEWKKECKP